MDNDKGTILIVDDELNALKVLSAILSAEGFLVIQASSVDEAIAAIKAKLPDTIITDMKMPGKSGLDLFKFIKTSHPGMPYMFLTA
jgi:two-component system response regulator HydG